MGQMLLTDLLILFTYFSFLQSVRRPTLTSVLSLHVRRSPKMNLNQYLRACQANFQITTRIFERCWSLILYGRSSRMIVGKRLLFFDGKHVDVSLNSMNESPFQYTDQNHDKKTNSQISLATITLAVFRKHPRSQDL